MLNVWRSLGPKTSAYNVFILVQMEEQENTKMEDVKETSYASTHLTIDLIAKSMCWFVTITSQKIRTRPRLKSTNEGASTGETRSLFLSTPNQSPFTTQLIQLQKIHIATKSLRLKPKQKLSLLKPWKALLLQMKRLEL